MEISFIGDILYKIETIFCRNFKLFIGKHEKTMQVLFLMIYIALQMILALCIINPLVTVIIIAFLFFLALERIFVYIWLDYERNKLKFKEEELRKQYSKLRALAFEEITKLKKKR